jgi:hypothetical protein
VDCEDGSVCEVTTGEGSDVECLRAECRATVGAGTAVYCGIEASCEIACTGACELECVPGASCALRCAGDAEASVVMGTASCS